MSTVCSGVYSACNPLCYTCTAWSSLLKVDVSSTVTDPRDLAGELKLTN